MADAEQRAKEGLDDFLAKAANPPKGTYGYAVKLGIFDKGDSFGIGRDSTKETEFFWLIDLRWINGRLAAKIDNDPYTVKNVRIGQKIEFNRSDIFDWFYMDGDRMIGNYSACAILQTKPSEDLRQQLLAAGLDCTQAGL